MQCILSQNQTTPERCLSNPWYNKGFCEHNQYKAAIDRCEGGYKSCELGIEIFKELAQIFKNFSDSLHQWSTASQTKIGQSKEFGTTRKAWIESIRAVENLAEIHENINENIQKNVIDEMSTYKNSKYEKSFRHVKKIKEFEKDFKKVHKPWLELLDKINDAKQAFHRASRRSHQAKRQLNAIESDLGSSDEEKQKGKDNVDYYEKETQKHKKKYSNLIEEMKEKQTSYEQSMFKVLERTDEFERARLDHLKLTFKALLQATSVEQDACHRKVFSNFKTAIDSHDIDADIQYFNKHFGRETKTKWPAFEDIHE